VSLIEGRSRARVRRARFADGKRENISLRSDKAESAVSGFAIVLAIVLQDFDRFELGGACQPDAVLGPVGSVFRRINSISISDCIYDQSDG
jgi:hypothetical protein